MKANSVRLTPLTPEEQQFASDNYDVIKWCMNVLHLREDDSDVASLGYLQAVKKWYARPDLHQYSFKTIARWSVLQKVHNARRKERKLRSLQESVPGTGHMAYGDAMTYDSMAYLTDAGGGKTEWGHCVLPEQDGALGCLYGNAEAEPDIHNQAG